jgi:hypothetical protein
MTDILIGYPLSGDFAILYISIKKKTQVLNTSDKNEVKKIMKS